MRAKIFLFLALLCMIVFSVSGCQADKDCPDCKSLENAPKASMFLSTDTKDYVLTATVYYENLSASPQRQPIADSTVIVYIYNYSFNNTYRIYTNAKGVATFNFSSYKDSSFNLKVLYCPFTCLSPDPGYSKCGFLQCLDYAGINCTLATCQVTDISNAPGATAPSSLKCYNVLPTIQITSYSPPPAAIGTIPPICFPLLLIFAMLGGALFLSGRNPFGMFDLSAPRIGRHIRYQGRGHGVSITPPSFLTQAMQAAAQKGAVKVVGAATKALASVTQGKKGAKMVSMAVDRAMGGAGSVQLGKGGPSVKAASASQAVQAARAGAGKGGKGGKGGAKGAAKAEAKPPGFMMQFIQGQTVTPWARYTQAWEGLKGLKDTFKTMGAEKRGIDILVGKKGFEKYPKATQDKLIIAVGEIANLLEKGQYGYKTTLNKDGVLLDKNGDPIIIKTKTGNGFAQLDLASSLTGSLTGAFQVGNAVVKISGGEAESVSVAGKALTGAEKDAFLKKIDFDSVKRQICDNFKIEATLHSDTFKGEVTIKDFNPLGDQAKFEVVRYGSEGEKNGVTFQVDMGGVVSTIDNETGKAATAEKLSSMGIGNIGKGFDALPVLGEMKERRDDFNAAKQKLNEAYLEMAGERYLLENPGVEKAVIDFRTKMDGAIESLPVSPGAKAFLRQADIDHSAIAQTEHEAERAASYARIAKEAGESESVQRELMANAARIQAGAAAARESLPADLKPLFGGVSPDSLQHPEAPEDRTKIDHSALVYKVGGFVADNANGYMTTKENPHNLNSEELFLGTLSNRLVPAGNDSGFADHKKLDRDFENFARVMDFASSPKFTYQQREGVFFEALYNLDAAGEHARAGKAPEVETKMDRELEKAAEKTVPKEEMKTTAQPESEVERIKKGKRRGGSSHLEEES